MDGFTTFAQIINFMILVVLLKRFFYGPLIRIMEERETRISQTVIQAQLAEEQANQHARAQALEKQLFLEQKAQLLAEAMAEIETWREKKIEDLRREIFEIQESWRRSLSRDRQVFLMKLRENMIRYIMHTGERVLRDLSDQQLESQIISVFMEKMEKEKDLFQKKEYTGSVRVICGFAPKEESLKTLCLKLKEWFPFSEDIRHEISNDLGMGIEVRAGDKKVAWNLEKYLKDLEKEILLFLPSASGDLA
jgi:F-type H+-transporting ATPase subunit b